MPLTNIPSDLPKVSSGNQLAPGLENQDLKDLEIHYFAGHSITELGNKLEKVLKLEVALASQLGAKRIQELHQEGRILFAPIHREDGEVEVKASKKLAEQLGNREFTHIHITRKRGDTTETEQIVKKVRVQKLSGEEETSLGNRVSNLVLELQSQVEEERHKEETTAQNKGKVSSSTTHSTRKASQKLTVTYPPNIPQKGLNVIEAAKKEALLNLLNQRKAHEEKVREAKKTEAKEQRKEVDEQEIKAEMLKWEQQQWQQLSGKILEYTKLIQDIGKQHQQRGSSG